MAESKRCRIINGRKINYNNLNEPENKLESKTELNNIE